MGLIPYSGVVIFDRVSLYNREGKRGGEHPPPLLLWNASYLHVILYKEKMLSKITRIFFIRYTVQTAY
jgi:hypothetical protein